MAASAGEHDASQQDPGAVDAYVCEAIAELEAAGHSPTAAEVAGMVDLDDETVGAALDDLVTRGIVRQATAEGDQVYVLAEATRAADHEAAAGQPTTRNPRSP